MSMISMYLLFCKYGLLCFGGGYVLVPLLIADFVNARGIMTGEEFARLVAVAQITPGPVGINTATYVGYKLFGITGATVGTLGLLTPALILVLLAMVFIKRFEKTPVIAGALAGLRPGAYGLMLMAIVVFAQLSVFTADIPVEYFRNLICGKAAEWNFGIRIVPLCIAAATVFFQLKTKISFTWLMISSAVIGALLHGIMK